MTEFLDIYDPDRNKTGVIKQRGDTLSNGEYVYGAEIWVFDNSNRLMITQRSRHRTDYPLWWECTGGLVRAGETPFEAVRREALEEVGLKVENAKYFKTFSRIDQHRDVFVVRTDIKRFVLQEEEVASYKFVTKDGLREMKDVFVPFIFTRVWEGFDEALGIL